MSTIVFGGHGFLGRHLVSSLAGEGRVLSATLQGGGDSLSLVEAYRQLSEVETIIYAAGSVMPGSPLSFVDASAAEVAPFTTLLSHLASSMRRPHLVLLSTAGAIYGPREPNERVDETSLPSPRSVYGMVRLAMEELGTIAHGQGHLRLSVVRLSNAYGPGQRVGGPSSLVRTLLECARSGREFQLLGSGEQAKDFVFVSDVVEAVKGVLRRPASASPMIFNVASGRTASVVEVLKVVEQVTGRAIPLVRRPQRDGDVGQGLFDIRLARETLGWTPKVALAEGVSLTWDSLQ